MNFRTFLGLILNNHVNSHMPRGHETLSNICMLEIFDITQYTITNVIIISIELNTCAVNNV